MRVSIFFISLFLVLFGSNDLQANTVSHTNLHSLAKPSNTYHTKAASQSAGQFSQSSENRFLICDEIEDEDEKNTLVKKYREREIANYKVPHYAVFNLYFFFKAPKAIALISAYTSPKYILQRTLRI